jgi:sulfur carrier protein ThiS
MATVTIKYRDKEFEVSAGMTVRDAIKKIGLQPEAVLAVSDGKLITDDTLIQPGMKLKLVAVVSGGAVSCTVAGGAGCTADGGAL